MNEFVNVILKLIRKQIPHQVFAATVKSVDQEQSTCVVSPMDGSPDIEDVRLKAAVDGSDRRLVIFPKVNSQVLCSIIDNNENVPVVISISEMSGWNMKMGNDFTCELAEDGTLTLNGGDNHGLAKVQSIADRLNTLENDLNTLKAVITGWTPTPNDGGAALKTAATPWAAQNIATTTYTDLENTQIKH